MIDQHQTNLSFQFLVKNKKLTAHGLLKCGPKIMSYNHQKNKTLCINLL